MPLKLLFQWNEILTPLPLSQKVCVFFGITHVVTSLPHFLLDHEEGMKNHAYSLE